jgi:hypothetical protein
LVLLCLPRKKLRVMLLLLLLVLISPYVIGMIPRTDVRIERQGWMILPRLLRIWYECRTRLHGQWYIRVGSTLVSRCVL